MQLADLERFIIAESVAAWRDLTEWDRECGGDGKLRDTAISLTRQRTRITLHCNYSYDARMLSVWFMLPEPLPPDEDIERGEIVGDWQRCNGGFLLRLHARLEEQPPELCDTLH